MINQTYHIEKRLSAKPLDQCLLRPSCFDRTVRSIGDAAAVLGTAILFPCLSSNFFFLILVFPFFVVLFCCLSSSTFDRIAFIRQCTLVDGSSSRESSDSFALLIASRYLFSIASQSAKILPEFLL